MLALGSVAVVAGISLVADRVVGFFAPIPVTDTLDLVFPPHSDMVFETHEFRYTVHTNKLGFRGGEVDEPRKHTKRVAVIGDSFTYGWGVELEDAWVTLVEHALREKGCDAELLNLGRPGAGLRMYAEIAEKAIPVLRPDVVVVAVQQSDDVGDACADDPQPPVRSRLARAVSRWYPNTLNWLQGRKQAGAHQTVPPPMIQDAAKNIENNRTSAEEFVTKMPAEQRVRYDALDPAVKDAFLSGNLNPFLVSVGTSASEFFFLNADDASPFVQQCIARAGACFARIRAVADRCGAKVVVVSLPNGAYVNRAANRNYARIGFHTDPSLLTMDGPDKAIAKAAALAGLSCGEATASFRRHMDEPDLFYELDGHFTKQGHRLYAESMTPLVAPALGCAPH
jgi:lysophospholipase L1-like esterase